MNKVNAGTFTGTPYKLSVSLSNCSNSQTLTTLNLTASADRNKQIPIEWKVTNEAEGNHYEIEHSVDGAHFSSLASVTPSLSPADEKTHNSNDALTAEGNNFYRVKEVDKAGNALYSNVVMVSITNVSGIAITPNPASTFVNVYYKNTMKQIKLLGSNGQLLQTATPNATVHQLQISKLLAGQYILRIHTANGVVNQKFIKQKSSNQSLLCIKILLLRSRRIFILHYSNYSDKKIHLTYKQCRDL